MMVCVVFTQPMVHRLLRLIPSLPTILRGSAPSTPPSAFVIVGCPIGQDRLEDTRFPYLKLSCTLLRLPSQASMMMASGGLLMRSMVLLLFASFSGILGSHRDENKDEDETTIVYSTHMKWDVAVVMSMLFLLATLVILLKVVYMEISSRLKTWHVRAFYATIIGYCGARGIFFVVVKLTMPVELYYFAWFVPILCYITGYVLMTRLWADVHAEARNIFRLKYRRLRGLLYLSEYVLIVVMVVVQLTMYIVLVLLPDDEYVMLQMVDLVWLIICGATAMVYAVLHFALIRYYVYHELSAENPDVERAAKGVTIGLISRADVLFVIWSLALFARLIDLSKALYPSADRKLAQSELFWLYIGPFYVLAELVPALVLLVDTTGFSTTRTLRDVLPNIHWNVFKTAMSPSPSTIRLMEREAMMEDSAALDVSRDALYDVAMDPRVAHWTIAFSSLELVGAPIGRGATGEVYRAVWQDSVVAVKQLRSFVGRDLEDFCDEILILSSLRHNNIVRFLGAVIDPPRHICIVSEFLERGNLRGVIDDARIHISLRRAIDIALDICRGMSVIHASDIIHRDLKPENLLLDKDFTVKIGDFGISKIRDFKNVSGGFLMTCVGSGSYIAPEVLLHKPYTQKADVFSFGIIFWEVLSRKNANVFADDCIDGVRPKIDDDMSPFLAQLLERCWHSNYKMRPSFPVVLTELKDWWAEGAPSDDEYIRAHRGAKNHLEAFDPSEMSLAREPASGGEMLRSSL